MTLVQCLILVAVCKKVDEENPFPFKGKVGMGMGSMQAATPIPTLPSP